MDHETFSSGIRMSARGRVLTLLVALITLVAAFAANSSTHASAADRELKFELDRGIINLGSATGVKIVDPDLNPPDNPAKIAATLADDGSVTAPKSAFTFPVKTIEDLETGNSLLPVVDAKIEITAASTITGSWDDEEGTGTVVVPAQADITVYPANSAASVAKCRVSGFNLDLATTGTLVDPATDPETEYPASAFTPPSGDGAVVDNWVSLPESTILGGSLGSLVCPAVNGLIGGPGGIWLEGNAAIGGVVVPTPPVVAPKITSGPAAETNQNSADFTFEEGDGETQLVTKFQCRIDSSDEAAWSECDSKSKSFSGLNVGSHKFEVRAGNNLGYGPVASHNWTVSGTTPPPAGEAKLGSLAVGPKTKAAKRGKKVTFTVKVRNAGDAAATGVKICVKAPAKLLQVKKCVSIGQVAAGKTATAKFKVTVKKKAKKGKKAALTFTATADGLAKKTAKAAVKIK